MAEIIALIGFYFAVLLVAVLFFYAFQGFISFPFYLLGLLFKIITFPVDLINQVLYPVGWLPYLIVSGFSLYIVVHLVWILFRKYILTKKFSG